MSNKLGLFISFEGIDGAGKTTIINEVISILNRKITNKELGFAGVLQTREPGGFGNIFCEKTRELIFTSELKSAKTEALLFAASRSEHIINVIEPKLKKNFIVVTDRFIDSTLAYQAFGKELDFDFVLKLNEWILNDCWPDITFFLEIDPMIAKKRILNKNRNDNNYFDKSKKEFYEKVSNGFIELSKKWNKRIRVIKVDNLDVNEIVDKILNQIYNYVQQN